MDATIDAKKTKKLKIMHPIKDLDILFQPIESENESPEYVDAGVHLINICFSRITDMDKLHPNIDYGFSEIKLATLETKTLNQQVFIKHRGQCKMEDNLLRHLFITIMQHYLFKQNRFDLQNGERIVKAMEHIRYLGCTLVQKNPDHYNTVRTCNDIIFIPTAFDNMRHYSCEQREVMKAWCYKELVVLYTNIGGGTYDENIVRLIVNTVNVFVIAFPRNPYRFRVLGELLYHRARAFFIDKQLESAHKMYTLAERTFMSAEDFASEAHRGHAVERSRKKLNSMKIMKLMQKKTAEKQQKEAVEKRKGERRKNRMKNDSQYVYMGDGAEGGPLVRVSFGMSSK